ncbi:MAG: hypothetical protein CVU84_09780 [Firmicutes bacterium HGW-Firmicutes-1]|jgi:hypothetical protein|nr:MAG: hypothetical protein CVU84_09780 [Firmicutes bacterium HGW-Firmicutes-1]
MSDKRIHSGVPALDEIIDHIWLGDNVVWKVDSLEDYMQYARAFASNARKEGRKILYIRFASHPPIIEDTEGVEVYILDSSLGFQHFSFEIYNIITEAGLGAYYIFDSLSSLQQTWATDLMIGNFFAVTCPYLFLLDTVAYFCIMRKHHDWATVSRILDTTQIMIDLNTSDDGQVVQPKKVWNRDSPTMFMPHIWSDNKLIPQTDGLHHILRLPYPIIHKLDYWEQLFIKAESLRWSSPDKEEIDRMIHRLCTLLLGKDEKILALAKNHFTLDDLLGIRNRMIGTGYIGGKSVGMLLARRILCGHTKGEKAAAHLQKDSLYIGSDVWQSFLIHNGLWLLHMQQRSTEGYFTVAKELHAKILAGSFPSIIMSQFEQALDALGRTPIIVRSSSLLEDGYGNAFAGKYHSVFCANQGDTQERMESFISAIRNVYASTVELPALIYRKKRGLNNLGEQMSVLVQRVSGSYHGNYFYPLVAGVGLSYSSYVWHLNMNPEAGMIRIVMGLGTRAVDRTDGDYTSIVSLDMPNTLPTDHHGENNSQCYMDVLDIENNTSCTISVQEAIDNLTEVETNWIISRDLAAEKRARDIGMNHLKVIRTDFKQLFETTDFLNKMRDSLALLEKVYECPVDVEFTMNKSKDNIIIDFVQCRPLQTFKAGSTIKLPENLPDHYKLFSLNGGFVGGGEARVIKTVVYVIPEQYILLSEQDRHEVARTIGKLNAVFDESDDIMLVVPGRCGSTMASLGVPVMFAEINKFTAICEESYPKGGMIPELSFGSHFFQDLVESNIFYASFFPEMSNSFNKDLLLSHPNQLSTLISGKVLDYAIHVATFDREMLLMSDMPSQKAMCVFVNP